MADEMHVPPGAPAEPVSSDRDAAPSSRQLELRRFGLSFTVQAGPILCAVAAVAALAALLTRGVDLALPGIWMGSGHIINAVKLGGALLSQLAAVASVVLAVALVLAAVQSSLPSYVRATLVGGTVLTILAVMIASAVRLPQGSRLVLTGAAAFTVLSASASTVRTLPLRAPSLVLFSMAGAALLRLGTMVTATLVAREDILLPVVRGLATGSAVLELAGVLLALAWLSVRPGFGVPLWRRARWVLASVVLLVAALGTLLSLRGREREADGAALLLARAVESMLARPEPYLPFVARSAAETLTWLTVAGALVLRPRGALASAAVALALVARGSLEVPLAAAGLVIAALALVLEMHAEPERSS
jgi:hypothetical protein